MALQLGERHIGRVEIFRVGIGAHFRAGDFVGAGAYHFQFFADIAVRERDAMHFAVALHFHFQPLRQGVGHRYAYAVQPAGKRIRAFAAFLVELAAGMQPREYQLDSWHPLFRMQAHRNAAAIVLHRNGAVGVHRHVDVRGIFAQRFVGRIIDDFLDDVRRVGGARVHAGPLFDRLQAFQYTDRCFFVASLGHGGSFARKKTKRPSRELSHLSSRSLYCRGFCTSRLLRAILHAV